MMFATRLRSQHSATQRNTDKRSQKIPAETPYCRIPPTWESTITIQSRGTHTCTRADLCHQRLPQHSARRRVEPRLKEKRYTSVTASIALRSIVDSSNENYPQNRPQTQSQTTKSPNAVHQTNCAQRDTQRRSLYCRTRVFQQTHARQARSCVSANPNKNRDQRKPTSSASHARCFPTAFAQCTSNCDPRTTCASRLAGHSQRRPHKRTQLVRCATPIRSTHHAQVSGALAVPRRGANL